MTDNTGNFDIATYCAQATKTHGLTLEQVKAQLQAISADPVQQAAAAYLKAANALTEAVKDLPDHAKHLAENWKGAPATNALHQLGQLHKTGVELANKSHKTGNSLSWIGHTILPWYKHQGDTMGHGAIDGSDVPVVGGMSGDDQHARDMLDRLNDRLAEGHNALPLQVSKDLPPHGDGGLGNVRHGGGGDRQGLTTGQPNAGGIPPYHPGGGIVDPNRHDIPPYHPGGDHGGQHGGVPHGGGADLAGLGSGGSGGLGSGGGLGGGSGLAGGGPAGMGAGGLDGGAGGLGGGTGGLGSGAGTAGMAGGGMPMGGGGGGGGGKKEERERTTWLAEDEDVWSPDEDTSPPVIG